MIKIYALPAVVLAVSLLGVSCKKNNDAPAVPPPVVANDVVETALPVLTAVDSAIDASIGGYYVSLPAGYARTTKNYPLLIFIPGGGQYGNGAGDLYLLLNDGIAKTVYNGQLPPSFNVNGKNYSFITLTPQLRSFPPDSAMWDVLAFAKKHYRVDSSRVYLSGLSIGGVISTEAGAGYFSQIAAIAPMADEDYSYDVCQGLAEHNMPVWDFHNTADPSVPSTQTTAFIDRINSYHPGITPRLTLFPVFGHDAWTQALDPAYKENNMNVYEWMLQYSK